MGFTDKGSDLLKRYDWKTASDSEMSKCRPECLIAGDKTEGKGALAWKWENV